MTKPASGAPLDAPLTVVLDASGSQSLTHAAVDAAARASLDLRINVTLAGDERVITRRLTTAPSDGERLKVLDATSPEAARDLATTELGSGRADAWITAAPPNRVADHVGRRLGTVGSLRQLALAAIMPTVKKAGDREDPYAIVLDAGAWPELAPRDAATLVSLTATLSGWFARGDQVRVGLLVEDPDPARLTPHQRELDEALRPVTNASTRYIGAITPEQALLGHADIVACDGRQGALFLRTLEGAFVAAEHLVQRETRGLKGRLGIRLFEGRLAKLRDYGNIESYGGWPFVGSAHLVLSVRHDASANAWFNAIRFARRMQRDGLVDRLQQGAERPKT